jgi:hypothetical protein
MSGWIQVGGLQFSMFEKSCVVVPVRHRELYRIWQVLFFDR